MAEVLRLRTPDRARRDVGVDVTGARPRLAALRGDDVALFRAALAVAAVAALDDAFLHPEPGVSAVDHLASGLVPAAVAAILIWAAPRMPGVLRGWFAIASGVLAVAGGTAEGVHHVLVDRFSGDDATAVLAALAGVVLVLLGVVTLWRTRSVAGSRAGRLARRAALGVGVLAAVVLLVVPATIAVVATHKARAPVTAADLGRPYEHVTLTTSDGLTLQGWYVPSRNRAAVIAFPGRRQPVPHARMLARHGYGVLLIDRRGEAAGDGDYNAFGWAGEPDLRAAIAFLERRTDVDPARIGGLGLSVGGELLLQTAAHTPALRAVVSEGAGQRSLAEHLDNPDVGRVQRWFTGMVAQTAAVAVLSNSMPPAGLADLAARAAPRPMLLIEAVNGNPDEVLNEVYQRAAGDSSELWKVSEGGHTGALAAVPAEYERRVVAFFDRSLLREEEER